MVSIATLDKALKTLYIGPVRQMLNVEADPFVARIKHTSEMIRLGIRIRSGPLSRASSRRKATNSSRLRST